MLTSASIGRALPRPAAGEGVGAARAKGRVLGERVLAIAHGEAVLAILVAVALALRFALVSRQNINWDEFYFLSLVHDHLRSTLASPFQTFHVHLFAWLPAVGGDEISQVLAGRSVMAGLVVADAFLLYGIGRRFLSRAGALFGLLAYLSFGYVIGHGTSFRVDPLLTTLLLLAIFAVLRRPERLAGAILAGIAGAIATMISVKAAFHLATIGALFLCLFFAADRRQPILNAGLAFATGYAVALAALFVAQSLLLEAPPTTAVGSFLSESAAKMFSGEDLQRTLLYLATDYVQSMPVWALLLGGMVAVRREAAAARGRERWAKLMPLLLCLPILTVFFYRNAFPYYYPLALAPGALLAGIAYERLALWKASFLTMERRRAMMAALVAVLVAMQPVGFLRHTEDRISPQAQVIAAVHAAFPDPVPYLDGYGAVATFPWAGFFMSTWGRDNYLASGRPQLAERAARLAPVFVLADSIPLAAALLGDDRPGIAAARLLPADERFLKDNYLPYWGPIFVAGKRIELLTSEAAAFEIHVPGSYRLDAEVPLLLDGRLVKPGSTIELARGGHRLAGPGAMTGTASLRWADVRPPGHAAPDMCLFVEPASSTYCALPIRGGEPAWDRSGP